MKNAISEVKNALERINSRLNEGEDQISKLENKIKVSIQAKRKGNF